MSHPSPPQLTLRAILTGMVLGGLLSLCTIYVGLKIGIGFNMSITAAILGFGVWRVLGLARRGPSFSLLENNISQTAASSAAAVSSAGLTAAIPALALTTGQTLPWPLLALWLLSVCLVGIVVAVGIRRQMIVEQNLPFAAGVAAAETLREMYENKREALDKVRALVVATFAAAAGKVATTLAGFGHWLLPGGLSARGPLEGAGTVSLANLGFGLSPSTMLLGVGALIGLKAGVSLLLGAVVAWGLLAPHVLALGWAEPGPPDALWYGKLLKWMIWPAAAMMVGSSLTTFALSGRSVLRAFARRRETGEPNEGEISRRTFVAALVVILGGSLLLQAALFEITVWIAALGVLLTFLLAVVAGRVSGETAITPAGPLGKVTQLLFGALSPGQSAANLMAANVTAGAAGQCGDLLHDFKTGHLLGATPHRQAVAQVLGALAGATAGAGAYILLIPDPQNQLLTNDWPAPSAASWKAVAEIFQKGIDAMPVGTTDAMIWAAAVGAAVAILERLLPRRARPYIPSGASMGLAFFLPALVSLTICLGSLLAALLGRQLEGWSSRFLVVIAAGLIAGESVTGVAVALAKVFSL